jgi:AraC-like DNA-binding protein
MSEPADATGASAVLRRPDPRLRGLVDAYHGYHYRLQQPGVHHGLPSTSLTLVIAFDQPIDVGWFGDPASRGLHWALGSGMSTRPAGIHHGGTQHGIQLDLTPAGARALLGVPAAALAGEIMPLEAVLGAHGSRLYDVLATASGWPARFAALDRELIALAALHRDHRPWRDPTLDRAWHRLHESRGRIAVAELAREVGWGRRRLTERFVAEYGIAPKPVGRLTRFAEARRLVVSATLPLAEVAAACGYADQAHLTREWRELAGVPPTRWLREERPFLQDRPDQP